MFEKILERLRKRRDFHYKNNKSTFLNYRMETFEEAIKIVQEVAKEYADKASEAREDFMEIVYAELDEDADNNRANRIIEAFDTYAPYEKGE